MKYHFSNTPIVQVTKFEQMTDSLLFGVERIMYFLFAPTLVTFVAIVAVPSILALTGTII